MKKKLDIFNYISYINKFYLIYECRKKIPNRDINEFVFTQCKNSIICRYADVRMQNVPHYRTCSIKVKKKYISRYILILEI